jgi:hypothetical protein
METVHEEFILFAVRDQVSVQKPTRPSQEIAIILPELEAISHRTRSMVFHKKLEVSDVITSVVFSSWVHGSDFLLK